MEEVKCSKIEAEKEDGRNNSAAAVDDDVHGNSRKLSGPTRRSSKANWTEGEDNILRDAVKKYEGKSWKKIAGCLPGRTDVQCLHRWQKVLNPDLVKGPWSKEEDGILIELVENSGDHKWSEIAEQLPGRMGKQCRERWYNHLKPEINKAAWTDEEERILISAHAEYGNKWSILAKLLPGRTENSVKNHWNCSLKKRLCSYPACGSIANHPRLSVPPLQANSKRVARDSTEANQTLSTTNLDSGSNIELCSMDFFLGNLSNLSSASGEARNSLPSTSSKTMIMDDMSKALNHGTRKTRTQGFASLGEDDPCHQASLVCNNRDLIRPRRDNDDNLERSSELSYTGLCYLPIQWADLDIFLSTGRFPSTESYICEQSRSRQDVKEPPCDAYSRARAILRIAATSYRNVPSIIRKRAIQMLHGSVSALDNDVAVRAVESVGI
ncbi:transcription factor MYB3R-1-like isoform X2 [Salvia miltiorrhiza]|uniref:transcription factor MYB3R-1-like isoform X2 n=1 Tax=Salvia miltiorrhiza TaxID=226208 RepID=UPI0025AC94F7|nr:transcription factor MYB3R-1-like isoform X2 [Salvia miltiorrhiza]